MSNTTRSERLANGTRVSFEAPRGKIRVGAIVSSDRACYEVEPDEKIMRWGQRNVIRLNHSEVRPLEGQGPT
jgi:hypothetical protein